MYSCSLPLLYTIDILQYLAILLQYSTICLMKGIDILHNAIYWQHLLTLKLSESDYYTTKMTGLLVTRNVQYSFSLIHMFLYLAFINGNLKNMTSLFPYIYIVQSIHYNYTFDGNIQYAWLYLTRIVTYIHLYSIITYSDQWRL